MAHEGLEELEHAIVGAPRLAGQGPRHEVLQVDVAHAHRIGVAVRQPGDLGDGPHADAREGEETVAERRRPSLAGRLEPVGVGTGPLERVRPPLLDPELGLRASPLGDAARLMSDLTSRGLRTICFAKSRKSAELIHKFTAERVDTETAARLAPYRAGYTPAQRRDIERRLVEGELLGVSATDALELGIDIGLLDCAMSVGFPGTVASLRQQWGRAGRRAGVTRGARR